MGNLIVFLAIIGSAGLAWLLLRILDSPIQCEVKSVIETCATNGMGATGQYLRIVIQKPNGQVIRREEWKFFLGNFYQGEQVLYYPLTGKIKKKT